MCLPVAVGMAIGKVSGIFLPSLPPRGWMVIALSWGVENQWELFCDRIGKHELIGDPRFETPGLRTKHHAVLEPVLIDGLRAKTTAEWLREFGDHCRTLRQAGE